MTQAIHNIANAIIFIVFFLLVATLLVIDTENVNGIAIAKYFWFYTVLSIAGIVSFLLAYRRGTTSKVVVIKTILLGILTVVIIDSFREVMLEMTNARVILLVVISYFFFHILFQYNQKFIKIFHFTLIAFALVEVIWGYMQLYGHIPDAQSEFRPIGSLNSKYAYAIFLGIMAPMALYWTITLFKKLKIKFNTPSSEEDCEREQSEIINEMLLFCLSFFSFGGIISILPITSNPVAWFAALCGCFVIVCTQLRIGHLIKKLYRRNKKVCFLLGLLGILSISSALGGIYHVKKEAIDKHILILKISSRILAEHPLLGVGIGHFSAAFGESQAHYFERLYPSARERALAINPRQGVNLFVQTAVETGIIGLSLCLTLLVVVLRKGILDLKNNPERMAIVGALIAFTGACLLSTPVNSLPLMIVLMLLLALCTPNKVSKYRFARSLHVAGYLVLGAFVIGITYPSYDKFNAYRKWGEARFYYNTNIYATAAQLYEPLVEKLQTDPKFLFEYGHALSQAGYPEKSNAVLQKAAVSIADPMIYNLLGKNHQALGNYELAEWNLQRAHFMVPHFTYSNFLLANLYNEIGVPELTLQFARQVIAQKNKENSSEIEKMQSQMRKLVKNIKIYPQ